MKAVAILITAALLSACSSTTKVAVQKPQYCHTNQTIAVQNGKTIDSITVVECTDDALKRAKIVGVDEKNCRRWERKDYVNGREKHYGGYICRDAKGNWRPLSDY